MNCAIRRSNAGLQQLAVALARQQDVLRIGKTRGGFFTEIRRRDRIRAT